MASDVREWTENVYTAKKVGVFVNASVEEIERTVQTARLDVVQLHGSESPEQCEAVREATGASIWKSWNLAFEDGAVQVPFSISDYVNIVDAILLDTQFAGQAGGTGHRFDWSIIPGCKNQLSNTALWVAGGLHPGNVGELVTRFRPDGVDVSSGIETDGTKDKEKMATFIENVRCLE